MSDLAPLDLATIAAGPPIGLAIFLLVIRPLMERRMDRRRARVAAESRARCRAADEEGIAAYHAAPGTTRHASTNGPEDLRQ